MEEVQEMVSTNREVKIERGLILSNVQQRACTCVLFAGMREREKGGSTQDTSPEYAKETCWHML